MMISAFLRKLIAEFQRRMTLRFPLTFGVDQQQHMLLAV